MDFVEQIEKYHFLMSERGEIAVITEDNTAQDRTATIALGKPEDAFNEMDSEERINFLTRLLRVREGIDIFIGNL